MLYRHSRFHALEMHAVEWEPVPTNMNGMVKGFKTI